MTVDLTKDDFEEIATFITHLINPENVFSGKIIWNDQDNQFEYTNEIERRKTSVSSDSSTITIERLIQIYQSSLHSLAQSQSTRCPVQYCECKYNSILIRKHDIFNALATHIIANNPNITEKVLHPLITQKRGQMIETLSGVSVVEQLIIKELNRIYHQNLYVSIPKNELFRPNKLVECQEGKHKYEETIAWKSSSMITIIENDPTQIQDTHSRFLIKQHHCLNCFSTMYSPWQASIKQPIKPFQSSNIIYSQMEEEFVPKKWQALQVMFQTILPAGQARVVAKSITKKRLSSTDRTLKQQLKQKIQKIELMMEIWEDIKEI